MANDMDIPFLTLNAWTGIWSTVFMIVAAVTDLNRIVGHLTRFTDEIFSGLISAIFIIDALGNPFGSVGVFWFFSPKHRFHQKYADDPTYSHYATAFLSCVLCFGTTSGAFKLRSMKRSRYLPNQTCRNIVCDFAVIINLILWSIIAKAGFNDVPVETLNVPNTVAPTLECCDSTCRTSFPFDCPEQEAAWGRRSWMVNLFDTNGKPWVPIFAAVPAILAFILIFLDNGITVRDTPERYLASMLIGRFVLEMTAIPHSDCMHITFFLSSSIVAFDPRTIEQARPRPRLQLRHYHHRRADRHQLYSWLSLACSFNSALHHSRTSHVGQGREGQSYPCTRDTPDTHFHPLSHPRRLLCLADSQACPGACFVRR
jgi:hypothetical protein